MSSQVIEECCRAVRHVLNKSSFQSNEDFYDLYKIDFSDAKMAVNELQDFIEEHVLLNKRNISCIEEIKRVFDNSVGSSHEGGISRELGLRQLRQSTFQSENIQANVIEDSGRENYGAHQGRIEILLDRNVRVRKEVKELGISLEEAQSEEPVIFESVNQSKALFEHDPLALKLRSEGRSNGIRRGNQFLAHSWSDLNFRELFVLTKELMCINGCQGDIKGTPLPIVAYYILSILLRGNPIEHILVTKVTKRRYKSLNNCLLITRDKSKLQFIINGWLYNQGRKATPAMHGKVLPIDQRHQVPLDVPDWAVDSLLAGIEQIRHYDSKEKISQAINSWLSRVNRKYPECRLTLQKLESFLVSYSIKSNFDLAESAYCHGNPQPAQAVQLYYTAVSKRRVNFIYQELWKRIVIGINEESILEDGVELLQIKTNPQLTMDILHDDDEFLGSQIVPKEYTVQLLVRKLKCRLKATKKINSRSRQMIEYHNAYVLYTLMFFIFSSGYRSVKSPFPDPRLLDSQTGFLTINDKDKTRMVWLTQSCRQQIKYYRSHMKHLANELVLLSSDSFHSIHDSLKVWESDEIFDCDQSTPLFFFLKKDGSCEEVYPSLIIKKLGKYFQLPLNSNRHYLRTNLVRHKCPAEVIDAFMGHWCHGRNPWDPFSSFDPKFFAHEIEKYLSPIIRNDGWTAIKSTL